MTPLTTNGAGVLHLGESNVSFPATDSIEHVESVETARKILEQEEIAGVIIGPGDDVLSLLGAIREVSPEIPAILLHRGELSVPLEALDATVLEVQSLDEREFESLLGTQFCDSDQSGDDSHPMSKEERGAEYQSTTENASVPIEQQSYALLWQHWPESMAIHDESGKLLAVNEAMATELGYSQDELESMHVSDIEIAVDEPTLRDNWSEMNPGSTVTFVGEHQRADGSTYPAEIWASKVETETGARIVVIMRNISDKQERKQRLERQSAALESSMDGIAILDHDGTYVYLNEAHADIYGYDDPEELVGSSWRRLYEPEEVERIEHDVLPQLKEEGQWRGEATGKQKDGETFPQEFTLTTLEDGGMVCVVRDITSRKRQERDLKRFRRAIQASGHAIFLTDRDGTITYANPAFEGITGYQAAEAIGENPRILKSGEMSESYYSELWETILAGEIWDEPIVNRKKNGERYHAHQTIAPIIRDGEITEFVAIQTDISERKRRKKQIDTLDRVLRHNLRNELNVVAAHAEALKADSGEVPPELEGIFEGIHRVIDTADKGRDLTQLLSTETYRAPVEVTTVIDNVIQSVQETAPEAEIASSGPDEAEVFAIDQIGDAIEELLTNAIEHNDQEQPSIEVTIEQLPATVCIHVADNGPGIPEMERGILQATHEIEDLYHGSGLGLWLVYWIVTRSGGDLTFDENEPRGSIVTLELPRPGS